MRGSKSPTKRNQVDRNPINRNLTKRNSTKKSPIRRSSRKSRNVKRSVGSKHRNNRKSPIKTIRSIKPINTRKSPKRSIITSRKSKRNGNSPINNNIMNNSQTPTPGLTRARNYYDTPLGNLVSRDVMTNIVSNIPYDEFNELYYDNPEWIMYKGYVRESNTIINNISRDEFISLIDRYPHIKFKLKFTTKESFDDIPEYLYDHIRYLDLSNTDVENVDLLGNVHTLNLKNTKVRDVSVLSNVNTLDLTKTHVIDINMLKNVKKLYIQQTEIDIDVNTSMMRKLDIDYKIRRCADRVNNCKVYSKKIYTDISRDKFLSLTDKYPNKKYRLKFTSDEKFEEIPEYLYDHIGYLDLSHTRITDTSRLGNIHTLNLMSTSVIDVSRLGNVHTLDLSRTQVYNVNRLGNVHTLILSETQVTDVSMLGEVTNLDISGTSVRDVSMLGNVRSLNISGTHVIDINMLGNVDYLRVINTVVDFDVDDDLMYRLGLRYRFLPTGEKLYSQVDFDEY
jgi:hypothetical protein